MVVGGSALIWMILIFAAVCLWQLLAGLGKIRAAKANPDNPQAPMLRELGMIQAGAGGVMLAANIVLNLPLLRAVM